MAVDLRHLVQHLELAAAAYGADLAPPKGTAAPRSARAVPTVAPREDASDAVADAVPLADTTNVAPHAAPAPAANAAQLAPGDDAAPALQALRQEVLPCTRCKLCESRTHVVFGEGSPRARVMFVGEAPGATEDQTGRPFVGAAGQLLDRIIKGAMGLQRQDVYIANINKCRPPGNREPAPEEVAACLPYLRRQIELIRPEVIVCLGRVAAQNLLGSHESTTRMRGRTHEYLGVPVIVTWHPAYLLRDPSHKQETWDDIKRVNRLLGLPEIPSRP